MADSKTPVQRRVVRNEQREDKPLKAMHEWLTEPEGHPKPDPRFPQTPDYWAR